MKFKGLVTSITLSLFIFASGMVSSHEQQGFAPDVKEPISKQRAIDEARAPVKSASDLRDYLATESATSPLSHLSPAAKQRFLDSLVFGEKGLGSYSYEPLQSELTASQIYDVLSLFGAQATTHLIKGAAIETNADRLIMQPNVVITCGPENDFCGGMGGGGSGGGSSGGGDGDGDHPDYACASRATCIQQSQAICMHSC